MASALFLLDAKGQSILARDFRGEVPLSQVPERFGEHVINADTHSLSPVFADDGVSYCWIKKNEIYAVAVTRLHTNAALLLTFLGRLVELLTTYYNKFEEEAIRDNFVITYELLDEIMDNGIPQFTEPRILKKFLTTSNKQSNSETARAPSCVTHAVSWRAEGIKHKKNEIFLDVVERVDALVGSGGQILSSEIIGTLRMKSFLSGMPELKLGLNDRLVTDRGVIKAGTAATTSAPAAKQTSLELRNLQFHQCVRLNKFESDGTISFVPPDGEFELMTYRASHKSDTATEDAALPFWVECVMDPSTFEPGSSRASYWLKLRSTFKPRSVASLVEIVVPAPKDASNPDFKCSSGAVKYHPERECFVWTLKQYQGQRDQILTATLRRPTSAETDYFHKRPIEVKFELPYSAVSGITVKYLKIFEASGYQALPWVRYITQSGTYQIRIS